MKKLVAICLAMFMFGVNSAKADLMSVVEDNFNSYINGSIIGQDGWESYVNGSNFIVQESTVFEGIKALYCSALSDNVVGKQGYLLADGRQTVYIKTENRDDWNLSLSGNVQIRMTQGLWGQPYFYVSLYQNGTVGLNGNVFDIYDDNEWTLLEMEWTSSNKTARTRINNGTWSDCGLATTFAGFDYVGFDYDNRGGGGGGVYFDALGANSIPEPSTLALLFTGLITGGLFFLRRK